MKKDVIYIDIEDEITGIISKLKESPSTIVAMVPPKRSTVLNSVVNLKLLKRAADDSGKRIVLITSEKSLLPLAGGLGFPVAKNLHSKPSIPEAEDAPEIDDSVIEGIDLDLDTETSIGELDKKHKNKDEPQEKEADDKAHVDLHELNVKDTPKKPKTTTPRKKSKFAVPNFEAFRLRVILSVVAVFSLAGLWFWAFKIAPHAIVSISAQTSRIDTNMDLIVNANAEETNLEKGVFKPQIQSVTRNVTQQFEATGEKDIGTKASGIITVRNCDFPGGFSLNPGTTFQSGELEFVSDEFVSVPAFSGPASSCDLDDDSEAGTADVSVNASEGGDNYNLAPTSYAITSQNLGSKVDAVGFQMSGGTSKLVKVVSSKDFNDAKKLLAERNFDELKTELRAKYEGEVVVIEESFQTIEGKFSSEPKVNAEAEKATATVRMTFTMMALERSELSQAIDNDVNDRISTDQQSIYESGIDNVSFRITKRVNENKLELVARAGTFVGPEINAESLAEEIAGKPFSEARAQVEKLPGVRSVDIDFDPFWVSKAPSANKITVEIEIAESTLQ